MHACFFQISVGDGNGWYIFNRFIVTEIVNELLHLRWLYSLFVTSVGNQTNILLAFLSRQNSVLHTMSHLHLI